MPFGFGFFGPILMIVFWGLIIYLIFYLTRSFANQNNDKTAQKNNTAMDILKERYAKGEIDKKEFEEKKQDLLLV